MSLELVRSNEPFETQAQDPFIQRMVNVNGVPFDEEFLGKLVANHFSALPNGKCPLSVPPLRFTWRKASPLTASVFEMTRPGISTTFASFMEICP